MNSIVEFLKGIDIPLICNVIIVVLSIIHSIKVHGLSKTVEKYKEVDKLEECQKKSNIKD